MFYIIHATFPLNGKNLNKQTNNSMLKKQAQFQQKQLFLVWGSSQPLMFFFPVLCVKSSFDIALFSLEENKYLLLLPMR